jgi:hypothetical protein
MIEAWVDGFLARPPDDLDAELAQIIDFVGRLRSDDARAVVAHPDGARWLDAAAYELVPAGDRLCPAGVRDGAERNGQIVAGPDGVPFG